jgi:crossover junction endodeoxyribonuclease RusA
MQHDKCNCGGEGKGFWNHAFSCPAITVSPMIRLPLPPTINDYYGVMPKTMQRYIKKPGKVFREEVGWLMKQQNKYGKAKLQVRIVWHFRGMRGDIDNRVKPLFDALENAGTFENDSQIRHMIVSIGHPVKGGAVDITIKEI